MGKQIRNKLFLSLICAVHKILKILEPQWDKQVRNMNGKFVRETQMANKHMKSYPASHAN